MIHLNSINNIDQFIEDFITEFKKGLPGTEAQQKMSPSIRNHSIIRMTLGWLEIVAC